MLDGLRQAPIAVWMFVLIGILAAVGVLVNTEFKATLTTGTQTDVIDNATLGIANITKQLPTVGTVIGVLIIVSAVVGLVGVFAYFRGAGEGRGMY